MSKLTNLKRGAVVSLSYASGYAALKSALKMMFFLGRYIRDGFKKKVPKYPNDTFAAACKRHGVGDAELVEIRKQFLARKRLYLIVSALCLMVAARGVIVGSPNIFLMSFLAWSFAVLLVFNSALRELQCKDKELYSASAFFAHGGFKTMLNFFEVKP